MLTGRSICLVPLDVDDITNDYVDWFNDPDTFRFLGSKFGQTRTSVRKYVERLQAPNMICKILAKPDFKHIGNIAMSGFDPVNRRVELGIVIGAKDMRGKGVGKEACSLLIQFGFDHLNIHKFTAGTVAPNVGMKKVFLDLGFDIEGTFVQHYFLEGQYLDYFQFGLIREKFKPASA